MDFYIKDWNKLSHEDLIWKVDFKYSRYLENMFFVKKMVDINTEGQQKLFDIFYNISLRKKIFQKINNIATTANIPLDKLFEMNIPSGFIENLPFELFKQIDKYKDSLTSSIKMSEKAEYLSDVVKHPVLIDTGSPTSIMSLKLAIELKAKFTGELSAMQGLTSIADGDVFVSPIVEVTNLVFHQRTPDKEPEQHFFKLVYSVIPYFDEFIELKAPNETIKFQALVGADFLQILRNKDILSLI